MLDGNDYCIQYVSLNKYLAKWALRHIAHQIDLQKSPCYCTLHKKSIMQNQTKQNQNIARPKKYLIPNQKLNG